jgi:hypothetical protein
MYTTKGNYSLTATKRAPQWDLVDDREPGWHRIGEPDDAPMRSRSWDGSDAEAPQPDTSRDVAALLRGSVARR